MPEIVPRTGPRVTDAFAVALQRAQAEFLEMPGLQLTEAQAAKLWGTDFEVCRAVLSRLVTDRFLVRTPRSTFSRA
jgi:DNA-binding GntR family transcriptional regulator